MDDPRLEPEVVPLALGPRLWNYVSWAFILASCTLMGPPLVVALALLRPFGKASLLGDAVVVWWTHTLQRLWRVEIEVSGLEHVVSGGPYVIVSNHRSHLDAVAIIQALRDRLRFAFLIKRSLGLIPIWGWFVWLNGYVPVDRGGRRRGDQLAAPAAAIRAGRSVLVFPEGTRAPTHRFLPFKRGAFVLAERAGAPILPIVVSGTARLLPKHNLPVRPGVVRVEVLPPIETATLSPAEKDALVDGVRVRLAQHYRLASDGPPAVEDPALLSSLVGPRRV